MTPDQLQAFTDAGAAQTPAGRVGRPVEIANTVSFLAGEEISFVNGIELTVDGGFTQI